MSLIVENPLLPPNRCAICANYKGAMIDTQAENDDGRVYVCKRCVVSHAQLFGIVKGDRHQELVDADDRLREAERVHDETLCKLGDALEAEKALKRELGEVYEWRTWAEGRIAQLEALVSEDAQARMALIENTILTKTA